MRSKFLYNSASEQEIHLAMTDLLRLKYKDLLWWHTPNGASFGRDRKRAAIQGRLLKRQGMLCGVPDLFFPGLGTRGVFVEIKNAKGKLSEAQVEIMTKLTDLGYDCYMVRSCDELVKCLDNYLTEDMQLGPRTFSEVCRPTH